MSNPWIPKIPVAFLVGVIAGSGMVMMADPGLLSHTAKQNTIMTTHPVTRKVATPHSILSPVAATLAHAVEKDKVYSSTGKLVSLPRNRPDLFTAWWCPHCHAALGQLKAERDLGKFNLVSIYVNGDTTKPVTTWKRAFALTEGALRKIDVSIPVSHIYLAMPNSPLNTQIKGVPTLWEFNQRGAQAFVGTPSTASVWRQARL